MRWSVMFLSVIVGVLSAKSADAICRRVTETGSTPPVIEPRQPVLIIKRQNVPIGCPSVPSFPDAAVPDASVSDDGGSPAIVPPADAGVDANTCVPRNGDTISMIVQPGFSVGPDGARFALLMVTPTPPVVTLAPENTFVDLAEKTQPMKIYEDVVVEDPSLGTQCGDPKWPGNSGTNVNDGSGDGCGGGGSNWIDPGNPDTTTVFPDAGVPNSDGGGVTIHTIGAYDVAILAVRDTPGLAAWLLANNYDHRQADLDALAPYLQGGWTVIAVRINAESSLDGGALTPIQFTYEASEIRLPTAVSRQPEGGQSLLTVFISADGRYNLPGASVPFAQPLAGNFFLTRSELFVDLGASADSDPVAVRDFTDERARDTVTVTREIAIPVRCPDPPPRSPAADDDDDAQGCEADSSSRNNSACNCLATGRSETWPGHLLLALLCFLVIRRRQKGKAR